MLPYVVKVALFDDKRKHILVDIEAKAMPIKIDPMLYRVIRSRFGIFCLTIQQPKRNSCMRVCQPSEVKGSIRELQNVYFNAFQLVKYHK